MKSMISDSLDEPAASKPMGLMRNDHSCCHGSNSEDEGSRGGSASLPTHSTSPFQSPRGRMSVASSHVPQPCPCGPRSRWDRCTIRHIRGAAGTQRRPSHRSAPQSVASPRAIRLIECRRSSFKHQRSFLSRFLKPPGFVVPTSTKCNVSFCALNGGFCWMTPRG